MKKCLTLLALGFSVFVSGCVVYPAGRHHYYRDGPRYEHSHGDRYDWYHRHHDYDHDHDGRAD